MKTTPIRIKLEPVIKTEIQQLQDKCEDLKNENLYLMQIFNEIFQMAMERNLTCFDMNLFKRKIRK